MELYKWQKQCLQAWERSGHRGIVNVVTGAGKTILALAAIDVFLNEHPDTIVKIVVPTIPLAYQWMQNLMHKADSESLRPGFFGGGIHDDPSRKVMIYVINSAREHLARHIQRELALNHHVLLICDECHHYQSRHNKKIFGFLSDEVKNGPLYSCLGLSATPFGTDSDHVLTESLGQEIYRYDAKNAVDDGIVSPFIVSEVSASFVPEELKEYNELSNKISIVTGRLLQTYPILKGLETKAFLRKVSQLAKKSEMDPDDPAAAFLMLTYERKSISNLASARTNCAIALLELTKESDKILVFCERINQAEEIAARIRRKYGSGSCGLYHSELTKSARSRILNEFRDGQYNILVSCKCLDEGLDVPDANIGIVLSSSAVERQRIQRLGRLIRKSETKSAACLYYIYIRESTDDAAYLSSLNNYKSFSLRYYTSENAFSNDLYEYASRVLLRKAEQKGYSKEILAEIRKCLLEGAVRPDYLIPEKEQDIPRKNAESVHERNYWNCMKKIGAEFRDEGTAPLP